MRAARNSWGFHLPSSLWAHFVSDDLRNLNLQIRFMQLTNSDLLRCSFSDQMNWLVKTV